MHPVSNWGISDGRNGPDDAPYDSGELFPELRKRLILPRGGWHATFPRRFCGRSAGVLTFRSGVSIPKEGFETPLNRSLSDAEFSELLSSSRVRAEQDCVGSITTAGINAAGEIGWSSRPCYFDEKLIELQVNGRWQVVASQGCFNLIEPPPQPERTIEISSDPMLQSAKVFVQETQGITVHVCDCPGNHSCHNDIYLPGYRAYLLQP